MISSAYIDTLQIHVTANYFLTSIKGLFGKVAPRKETYTRNRRSGIINRAKFHDGRLVELRGVVIGSTNADFITRWDALMGAMAIGTVHTLYFTRIGGLPEQIPFIVDSEVTEQIELPVLVQEWSVQILSEDPRVFSQTLSSLVYDPTTVGTGNGIKMTGGIKVVGGIQFFGTGTVGLSAVNGGNAPTPPVFTLRGPVTNPIIDNDATNQHIYTTGLILGATDTLVIDVGARTVTLNGTSRPDLIDSSLTTWFDLIPGPQNIRMRGTGMTTGQTSLQVQWRDARN